MKPLISHPNPAQPGMFRPRLPDIINPNHPLVKLAGAVDWLVFHNRGTPYLYQSQVGLFQRLVPRDQDSRAHRLVRQRLRRRHHGL